MAAKTEGRKRINSLYAEAVANVEADDLVNLKTCLHELYDPLHTPLRTLYAGPVPEAMAPLIDLCFRACAKGSSTASELMDNLRSISDAFGLTKDDVDYVLDLCTQLERRSITVASASRLYADTQLSSVVRVPFLKPRNA